MRMITSDQLAQALERQLAGTPCFVVTAEVRPTGKAVVEVDNDSHITLAELAEINRNLRDLFGEALDDVELEVGSPGMGRPFRVMRQYQKSIGRLVSVKFHDGRELEGILENASGAGIELRVQHRSTVKGRPPKLDKEVTAAAFADIQSTGTIITFK
jgi:ribosome maturation factor RimP